MTEPTDYPYRGMSEGFAGEWVDGAAVSDGDLSNDHTDDLSRPTPPPPPVSQSLAHEGGPGVGDKLSALLQSAVDEQVHEQRQLVQLMAEIQSGLNRRSDEGAADLRAVVENAVGGAVSQLTDNFRAGMQTLREQHDAQIADLSNRLSAAQNELHGLRELAVAPAPEPAEQAYHEGPALGDLVDGLAGMRTELRTLPEQMAPFVASALSPAVADLGRTLAGLEDVQQATSQDTARVHAALSAVLPRLEGVPDQIAALGNQVASLRAAQAELALSPRIAAGPDAHEIADIVRKGVRDATRDFVRDYLRDAVRDIVTVSTRDTERRITDHVDEAVLALAQALLTRRPALAPTREYVAVTQPVSQPVSAEFTVSQPAAESVPEPVVETESAQQEPGPEPDPEPTPQDPPVPAVETPATETAGPEIPAAESQPVEAESAATEPAATDPLATQSAAEAEGPTAPPTHRRRGLFRRK